MLLLRSCLFLLPGLLPGLLAAQLFLEDDFSDGDFTASPAWLGQTAKFSIAPSGELQLLDPAPGSSNTAYLSVAAPTAGETTWDLYLRMAFSPSSSNYARVYLMAAQSDLLAPQNAYYLRFGGISGNGDALELFRQDGSSSTLLISGQVGALGGDPVMARVRVTRSAAGQWTLLADYAGGEAFVLQGTASDATHAAGAYFGLACYYTSTRSDKFFLDDVRVGPLFEDMAPPLLLAAEALADDQVRLSFDEALSAASAQPGLYSLSAGRSVEDVEIEGSEVFLSVSPPLENLAEYSVSATGVSDLNGNTAGQQTLVFGFFQASPALPYDVLITELLADPTPPLGLPAAEYVEIHNRSAKVIATESLRLGNGGTPQALPSGLLLPGEYAILCDDADAAAFVPFGKVLPLASMPALTNTGDDLSLQDADGLLLDAVFYKDAWLGGGDKAEGGWALERISNDYFCGQASNWLPSQALAGGTPGAANSVAQADFQAPSPVLVDFFPEDAFTLRLLFSAGIDAAALLDAGNYSISPALAVQAAVPANVLNNSVELLLAEPLAEGQAYILRLGADLVDCQGRPLAGSRELAFGLPLRPTVGDVLLSEILFDPRTGGEDFLELYNASDKILDPRDLIIANIGAGDTVARAVQQGRLWLPGSYLVLTASPANIEAAYSVPHPDGLLANELPPFNNDAGNVTVYTLLDGAGVLLDAFDYDEDMHHPLLDDAEGVSLERLRFDVAASERANWQSAAASAGYATPTGPNSQRLAALPAGDDWLRVEARFSPDGDGFEDVLPIVLRPDREGYALTLEVYDANGLLVATPANNELLGQEALYAWDGARSDGSRAPMGIYVAVAKLFHPDGEKRQAKQAFALVGRLD